MTAATMQETIADHNCHQCMTYPCHNVFRQFRQLLGLAKASCRDAQPESILRSIANFKTDPVLESVMAYGLATACVSSVGTCLNV